MKIAFFGSSLVSAYWNGAATYYRGMLKALHARGHKITFYEPDAYERQQHRDIEDPPYSRVVVYANEESACLQAVEMARDADLIVKASGVGVFDELLEAALPTLKRPSNFVVFWDVDAPATLDSVHGGDDPFEAQIPLYDGVFTYGGGSPVARAYEALGAKFCVPIYNAVDADTHFPVSPDPRFAADLGFLGNRLPDREARCDEFFFNIAYHMPHKRFLLGGSGWGDKGFTPNVNYAGHVYTADHNAFNCSPLAVLNIARDSMARYGFSPATRVFEAAGAGACLITDAWEGVECFYEPGEEILVARTGHDMPPLLEDVTPEKARLIGQRALKRTLAHHQYIHRAGEVERVLTQGPVGASA